MASEPSDSIAPAPTDSHRAVDALMTSEPAISTEPVQTDHDKFVPATPVVQEDTYDLSHDEENTDYGGFDDLENIGALPETTEDSTGKVEGSPENTEDTEDIEDFLDPPAEGLQGEAPDMAGGGVEGLPDLLPPTDLVSYEGDAKIPLLDFDRSATTDAPMIDIEGLFQLPTKATIVDLDDYETSGHVVVNSELKIKEEIPDDDVVMTSFISKHVDLEGTTASDQVAATEDSEEATDAGISTNSNAPEPTQDDKTVEPSSEGQQQPRIPSISRTFLKHPKDKDRGLMDKRQQERVTKAFEALQRKAARENPDLPAYPSPQPAHSEKSDADMGMDDVTESDTTPPPGTAYLLAKRSLERRRKLGSSTMEDEVLFKKLEIAENLRIARFRQRRDYRIREQQEQEESLFVEQDTDGGHLGDANESSDENIRIPKRPADGEMYAFCYTQCLWPN